MEKIRSMTGYGRYEFVNEKYKIAVEIKSVNHRYLDLSMKMPKRLNYAEAAIRNLMKEEIKRGKVDLYVTFEDYLEEQVSLSYHAALAKEYVQYACRMEQEFGLKNDLTVSRLMQMPEVLSMQTMESDDSGLWLDLSETIRRAVSQFVRSRELEGEQLKADLLEKLDGMEKLVDRIEKRFPEVVLEYQNRLSAKLKELLADQAVEESRILTEAAVFADKICVDEEMVRLRAHIQHMKEALVSGEAVGRKLDFLAQEMNREANTTLSKSNDRELSDAAIDLKTEIEKIREQIQNLE